MRQMRKKRIQLCAQQAKQATEIATKVPLSKNKSNSGGCSAAKKGKISLPGRHLSHSSNNNAGTLQCGHCGRMEDEDSDSYFQSLHIEKYSRSLPTRIIWSASNTQYSSNFTSDSPPQDMVIFHEERDAGGSHAGPGQEGLPLATSRSKPADPIQDGDVSSMPWGVRQGRGGRKLWRVECRAQQSEKTLDAALGAERQNGGAATGAHAEQRTAASLNNARKMTLTPKVEPQPLTKSTSVAEPSQQNEKSVVTASDTGCLPDNHSVIGQRSITITRMHPSCLSVSSKVQTAHEPACTSAEKPFVQNVKGLVAPSEAGKKDSGAARRAMSKQSMVGSLQNSVNSAVRERPTIRSSTTAPVQPSVETLLVSNSGVYFSGAEHKQTCQQSDKSSVIPSEAGRRNSGAAVGVEKEQPPGDFFKNKATEVSPVVGPATITTLVEMSAVVPFSNSHGLSSGTKSKPTNGTTSVAKPSPQSEKSLLAGRRSPHSHSLIRQRSVPAVLSNSSKLNIKFKVRMTPEAVDKSSQRNEKSLARPHGADRQSSGPGLGAQRKRTTGVSPKNNARNGTSCLRWSCTTKPTQTPSARSDVSVSNSEDHPSATKPEQTNQTNSVDKPCQQSETSSVNGHHTDHLRESSSVFGQTSIPPEFVHLSNLNVACRVEVSHQPGTRVDKPSQQSEKNLVTAHGAGKQNSSAALRAQREQPMGGSLKLSTGKVIPSSYVSVSKSVVHTWCVPGTNPQQTTKSKPVDTLAAVPFSNSRILSFGEKPKPTKNSTSVNRPSHQWEQNLVAESETSGLPESLLDQRLIPPAVNAMHSSKLNISCNIGIALEPGPSLEKPQQSKKNLVMCHADRPNSGAATGSQSKEPVEGSVNSSSKGCAATTPARTLPSVSNLGRHPSVSRLAESSGQSNEATKGAQRKQPAGEKKKCLVAVHDAGEQSSGSVVGAQSEGNHQPMDGSRLSVSIFNVKPADLNPESTNKTTSVDNPSWRCKKSSVAGLDTSLTGQSLTSNTFMQSSDQNYKLKVQMAHQPNSVRRGEGGTRLSSAQVEKPSEAKHLHRYAAYQFMD